jgi:hypothetical protein
MFGMMSSRLISGFDFILHCVDCSADDLLAVEVEVVQIL